MSLCLLKTRDLSRQDHSINIELILAPKKTDLLSKQHRSLGSKCDDEVTRYELKQNSFLKHLKLERHFIGQKATEFYVLKTKMLLENIPVDLRKEMLSRRSFSTALNKIRDEVLDNQQRAKSESYGRIRKDSYNHTFESRETLFPQLPLENRSGKQKDIYLTEVPDKSSELPPVVIGMDRTRPRKPTLRGTKTDYISRERESSGSSTRPKLTRQKSVRFENENDPSIQKSNLQEKVREFIKEQEFFNSQVRQLHRTHVKLEDDHKTNDKQNLMNAFDNFCRSQNQKHQLHKLVKLASKFKTCKSVTNSIDHFKSSRSYQTIQSSS